MKNDTNTAIPNSNEVNQTGLVSIFMGGAVKMLNNRVIPIARIIIKNSLVDDIGLVIIFYSPCLSVAQRLGRPARP